MSRTPIAALVATGGFVAALMLIVTGRFYGALPPVPPAVSVTMWLLAFVCVVIGVNVRRRTKEGRVGLDRSQLNPLTAAQFLVVGKACSWTGAVFGGAYLGMAVWVVPRAGELASAAADLPGVLASAAGGFSLVAAGIFVERSCEVPPPGDGEAELPR